MENKCNLKRLKDVFSSDPPCKNGKNGENRFTTIPLKPLSDQ